MPDKSGCRLSMSPCVREMHNSIAAQPGLLCGSAAGVEVQRNPLLAVGRQPVDGLRSVAREMQPHQRAEA